MNNPRIPRKPGQPANSKKHSDLYTDENPKGTIHGLGFKDVATAKASVSKIRNSSRSHAHKIQAAIAMEQRAREMGKTSEAAVYRKFINSMKKKTKEMNEAAFSHKTPHLKGKQHQLDPNLDLKQLVHHATVQYVDRDADGDVDVYDNPKKGIPDENVSSASKAQTYSKKLIAKQKGEIKHTKVGMAYEEIVNEEGLRKWFQSKSKDGKRGWVNVVTGGTCASDEPGEGVPKCVSSAKRSSMTPTERLSAARRKKAADPGQQQKTDAAKPTYVPTDSPRKEMKKEEVDLQEVKDKPGKGSGTKDACYHKVKSRYSVWPSAYASGALVKCRKVGAANWGTKSEETMHEEERYCPLCDKRETRSECSYGEKAWDKVSVKDEEYSMARSELKTIHNALKRLEQKVGKGEGNLEAWVQSKITKAADYIDTAADYIDSGEMEEQKCWPGYKKKGTQKLFGKTYNRCVKAENVTIEDADGKTFAEVIDVVKPEPIKGFKSQIQEAIRLQSQTGNVIAATLMWRGKYYAIRMFFPQVKLPTRQEVTDEIQKVYPGGKVVYHSISEIEPGRPLIQAVGPQGGSFAKPGSSKNYVKPMGEEVEVDEDWQKVNRQDKTDGLSRAAVKAYRRENPGSKLQTAVTEKNPSGKRAKRRANFCRRMSGMKAKLTSAKTARDPDSRINKALRRWNCN
jgi:hypothetical protein